jgi:hypothetical protein
MYIRNRFAIVTILTCQRVVVECICGVFVSSSRWHQRRECATRDLQSAGEIRVHRRRVSARAERAPPGARRAAAARHASAARRDARQSPATGRDGAADRCVSHCTLVDAHARARRADGAGRHDCCRADSGTNANLTQLVITHIRVRVR